MDERPGASAVAGLDWVERDGEEGMRMTNHSGHKGSDSRADAAAIFALIMLVVVTAVFWVSQQ
jgi:hypothetical protein